MYGPFQPHLSFYRQIILCFGRNGAYTSQHGTLLYDDTQYLLALAVADNAIWGIETSNDLWHLQIPEVDDELPLRWNDSILALPILRNATVQQGITDRPFPKRSFDRIVISVLKLSGDFGNATTYVIRRRVGEKSMVSGIGSVENAILLTTDYTGR